MPVDCTIPVLWIEDYYNLACEPNLGLCYHRQEKPDLQELPESAPAGIVVAPFFVLLTSEKTLFISGLQHALQVTEDKSEEGRILSKTFPHDLQIIL